MHENFISAERYTIILWQQILTKLIFGDWLKNYNWQNLNLAKVCFLNKLTFHLACEVVMHSNHNYFRLDWHTCWLMLTNCSDLGNAKLVAPINQNSYAIHIPIVFSIDMPFLASHSSFRTKWNYTWWKAVYVAFTCIKTFGCQLQESAFHVKWKTVMHSNRMLYSHLEKCKRNWTRSSEDTEGRHSDLYNYWFPLSVYCRSTKKQFADTLQAWIQVWRC